MRCRVAFVAVALSCLFSGVAGGLDAPPAVRRIIGAGDAVPGLGPIGTYGFDLVGLDASGRALLLHDGISHTPALYWADGHGLTLAVDPAALEGLQLLGAKFGWNQQGALAVLATAPGPDSAAFGAGLFVVDANGVRRGASAGDRDADGNPLCRLDAARTNAAGEVALLARIATAGRACGETSGGSSLNEQAIYRVGSGLQRLVIARQLDPPGTPGVPTLDLIALADDGSVIVGVRPRVPRIVRLSAAGISDVLGPDTRGPSGAPIRASDVVAASPSGDLLFRAFEGGVDGLYRTAGEAIVRVFARGDVGPDELRDPFDPLGTWGALNDAGDVLFGQSARAVLFPANGSPASVLPGIALAGSLNAAGDIAVTELTGDDVTAATRWRDGAAVRLARTGDALPDGGVLANHGFTALCAAADGRTGVAVDAVDGSGALVCNDADGPHVVARVGDPAPGGRRFFDFQQCAFAPAEGLVFTAALLVPTGEGDSRYTEYRVEPSLYRTTPERVERLIGRGDVTVDGELIFDLIAWSTDDIPALLLDADASGRVLTLATLDQEYGPPALVRRDSDGSLHRLPVPLYGVGGGWRGIGFSEPSVIDHRYLSGESDTPTLPPWTNSVSSAAISTARLATEGPAYYQPTQARLLGDGVILLASQRVYDGVLSTDLPVVLVWSPGDGLREVFSARDPEIPDYRNAQFNLLRVAGDRAMFRVSRPFNERVFTYTLGDARARELPPPPQESVFGFLGQWSDGRALFETPSTPFTVSAWDGAVLESLLTLGDEERIQHSSRDALFFGDADTLQVLAPPLTAGAHCPQPPPIVAETHTATMTPTATRTPTPSAPDTQAPTRTPRCPTNGVCLQVGSASAAAAERAVLQVTLTDGRSVAGTQNDLTLPPFAQVESCSADPASDKQVAFRDVSGAVRVLVLSLDNGDPIGDSPFLYRCTLRLAADAAAGRYPIVCNHAGAADGRGVDVPAGCLDGELIVSAAPTALPTPSNTRPAETTPTNEPTTQATTTPTAVPSATPTRTPVATDGEQSADNPATGSASSGSCAVGPPAGAANALPLLLAGLLAFTRSRRKGRRQP
ncbi:MAG: hypothetical protein ABI629_12465 [bacterium]